MVNEAGPPKAIAKQQSSGDAEREKAQQKLAKANCWVEALATMPSLGQARVTERLSERVSQGTRVEKVNWLDALYLYLNTSSPYTNMPCADLRIPDTFVFKYQRPAAWYFAENGRIVKKDDRNLLSNQFIVNRLQQRAQQQGVEPVAYYIHVSEREDGTLSPEIEYFDAASLDDFMKYRTKHSNGIVQGFIAGPTKSPGGSGTSAPARSHSSILRLWWTNSFTTVEVCTNIHTISDSKVPLSDRLATFDGSEHLSTKHIISSDTALWREAQAHTGRIVAHISELLPPDYFIKSICLYFKVGMNERLYLLWCNQIRLGNSNKPVRDDHKQVRPTSGRIVKQTLVPPQVGEAVPKGCFLCPSCGLVFPNARLHKVSYRIVLREFDHSLKTKKKSQEPTLAEDSEPQKIMPPLLLKWDRELERHQDLAGLKTNPTFLEKEVDVCEACCLGFQNFAFESVSKDCNRYFGRSPLDTKPPRRASLPRPITTTPDSASRRHRRELKVQSPIRPVTSLGMVSTSSSLSSPSGRIGKRRPLTSPASEGSQNSLSKHKSPRTLQPISDEPSAATGQNLEEADALSELSRIGLRKVRGVKKSEDKIEKTSTFLKTSALERNQTDGKLVGRMEKLIEQLRAVATDVSCVLCQRLPTPGNELSRIRRCGCKELICRQCLAESINKADECPLCRVGGCTYEDIDASHRLSITVQQLQNLCHDLFGSSSSQSQMLQQPGQGSEAGISKAPSSNPLGSGVLSSLTNLKDGLSASLQGEKPPHVQNPTYSLQIRPKAIDMLRLRADNERMAFEVSAASVRIAELKKEIDRLSANQPVSISSDVDKGGVEAIVNRFVDFVQKNSKNLQTDAMRTQLKAETGVVDGRVGAQMVTQLSIEKIKEMLVTSLTLSEEQLADATPDTHFREAQDRERDAMALGSRRLEGKADDPFVESVDLLCAAFEKIGRNLHAVEGLEPSAANGSGTPGGSGNGPSGSSSPVKRFKGKGWKGALTTVLQSFLQLSSLLIRLSPTFPKAQRDICSTLNQIVTRHGANEVSQAVQCDIAHEMKQLADSIREHQDLLREHYQGQEAAQASSDMQSAQRLFFAAMRECDKLLVLWGTKGDIIDKGAGHKLVESLMLSRQNAESEILSLRDKAYKKATQAKQDTNTLEENWERVTDLREAVQEKLYQEQKQRYDNFLRNVGKEKERLHNNIVTEVRQLVQLEEAQNLERTKFEDLQESFEASERGFVLAEDALRSHRDMLSATQDTYEDVGRIATMVGDLLNNGMQIALQRMRQRVRHMRTVRVETAQAHIECFSDMWIALQERMHVKKRRIQELEREIAFIRQKLRESADKDDSEETRDLFRHLKSRLREADSEKSRASTETEELEKVCQRIDREAEASFELLKQLGQPTQHPEGKLKRMLVAQEEANHNSLV
eukprot:Rmarinus@m.1717